MKGAYSSQKALDTRPGLVFSYPRPDTSGLSTWSPGWSPRRLRGFRGDALARANRVSGRRAVMTRFAIGLAIGLSLCSASTARAQDYRGRLQGSVTDESKSRAAGGHDHADQRCDRGRRRARHRRRWQIPVRLRRSRHVHDHRRARRIQEAGTEERPRAAARRRHGRSDVVSRRHRRDGHGRSAARQGAVQYEQLRHHAGAAAHRSTADHRPQSVQPGQPGSHDHARRSATRTVRTITPTPTTTTQAAAPGARTTCCSTACRSGPATRRPTRRPWTRSRKSRSPRTAWTRRTATASAASSA